MKSIIDKHFSTQYNYYLTVCLSFYKGNSLAEDLLHESYCEFLKVKPAVIEKFNEIDKLHFIGIRIIKRIYFDRHRTLRNKGRTSPLFESRSVDYELDNLIDEGSELDALEPALLNLIEAAQAEPVKYNKGKEISKFLKVKVFVLANEKNLLSLSKQTGISRRYLTKIYQQGKQYLNESLATLRE